MNFKLGFPVLTLLIARQMPNIYSLNEITDRNIKNCDQNLTFYDYIE